MKRYLKIFGIILIGLVLIVTLYFGNYVLHVVNIGAGYKSKILCSSLFVSGMEPGMVLREDLSDPRLKMIKEHIDYEMKQVTASAPLGIVKRTAIFREGLGATLDLKKQQLQFALDHLEPPAEFQSLPWPKGNAIDLDDIPPEIDNEKLASAMAYAFDEPDSVHLRRTRALVIVYKGKIIAEQYGAGITPDMPLLGWSMTKSVVNALVGILVGQGKLVLDDPAPVPEWQKPDDPRRSITLNHLLQMSSGLEFEEKYSSLFSDVIVMLFREKDAANFAITKPLLDEPGSKWSYNSGTTNIICWLIRQSFKDDEKAYLEFPQKELFQRLSMYSAIIEPDASGTFVGSSYMYATARDWARFGLLYLQDGVWEGERILPPGWVEYTLTPATHSKHKKYGAHFWLSPRGIPIYEEKLAATLPPDLYTARGHYDQYVTIIPSKNLVVVRLGLSLTNNTWNQAEFVARVLAAISEKK